MSIHRLHSILATTDLTEGSDPAIESACALGMRARASVHLIHCIRRPGPFGWWHAEAEPGRRDAARRTLQAQVERVCGAAWQPASEKVTFGRPVEAIVERAREVEADLIVLGRRPRGLPGATLLGTTGDRTIRTAAVPCLLADHPLAAAPGTVLLATDFSPSARHARDLIVDWLTGPLAPQAPGDGAPRLLMLSVSAFADPERTPRSPKALLTAEADEVGPRLKAAGVELEPFIHSAPTVAEGVDAVARDRDADLVVVGTHGHHPVTRLLVGSVATAVASSVDRPILVIPPPAREAR